MASLETSASSRNSESGVGLGGAAVACCIATGFGGWIAALASFLQGNGSGAGTCLVASAVAFGLVANAIFRR